MRLTQTVVLSADTTLSPVSVRMLNTLLARRCGPCRVIQERRRSDDLELSGRAFTYRLRGRWQLPPAEVHSHLIAATLELLV